MKYNPLPTVEFLRVCMVYTPRTGLLRWRVRPRNHFANAQAYSRWNNRYAGKEAFGYVHTKRAKYGAVGNRWFYAHRVIWKIVTGKDPLFPPDHRDRNPANNQWKNLRKATPSQNGMNHSLRCDNSSGHAGVFFNANERRWKAQINAGGKRLHLGTFGKCSDAIAARQVAERKMHGRFAPDAQRQK